MSILPKKLAYQLITNKWDLEVQDPRQNTQKTANHNYHIPVGGEIKHKLVALSTTCEKQRLQRKCLICRRVRKKQLVIFVNPVVNG